MRGLRATLPIVAAIIATWWLTTASAQSGIPDGVFVRESSGAVWLILNGQRVAVPFWIVAGGDAHIQAIPKSDRYAVMNDAGAIVPGDIPAWAFVDQPPPTPTTTPVPADRQVLTNVAGQQATSDFLGVPQRATVQEMTILHRMPQATDPGGKVYPPLDASGKFVIVLTQVENIGKEPVCCIAQFRLRDSRGRLFSTDIGSDTPAKQAQIAVYPIPRRNGDFQPSMIITTALVYDVPEDATGFSLAGR